MAYKFMYVRIFQVISTLLEEECRAPVYLHETDDHESKHDEVMLL